MRREHDTILVNVLDQLSGVLQRPGPFHITVLAARANLPHDRLRNYLDELVGLKLILLDPIPMLTSRGREFLDCYHAWVRIQRLYGLDPGAAREVPTLEQPIPQAMPIQEETIAAPDVRAEESPLNPSLARL